MSSLSLDHICAGLVMYKDSLRHTEIFFDTSKQQFELNVVSIGYFKVDWL